MDYFRWCLRISILLVCKSTYRVPGAWHLVPRAPRNKEVQALPQ